MDGIPGQDETFEKQTDRYDLSFRHNPRSNRYELTLRGRGPGRHSSVHTHFDLLSDRGEITASEPITPEVARFIFDNFERRGDTQSFAIYASELAGRGLRTAAGAADPQTVRHHLSEAELAYTSTGAKLAYHGAIFDKYRETGYGSIIRATMTLHQVCSSRCQYCSTILRGKADSVSLDEAKAFVTALYDDQAAFNLAQFPEHNARYRAATGSDIRLRGLILSGGGQPNLWPHFVPFVEWLAERDIDLGLITNGFPRNIPEDIYRHFKWVRLSITPPDASAHYPGGLFEKQYIPESLRHNPATTVGLSYVHGPWSDDDTFRRIDRAIGDFGFDYCRVLADCNLTRGAQLAAHTALAERLYRLGLTAADGAPKNHIFHQLKYHGTTGEAAELWDEGQCHLQIYNTFWDTTGHEANGRSFCYPCDSVTVLAEEANDAHVAVSERRFNPEKWGTVPNTEVVRLFTEPVRPYFDPRENCSACLFMRNNRTVKALVAEGAPPPALSPAVLDHVNFP